MKKTCLCCGRIIKNIFNRKYCNNCAIHSTDIIRRLSRANNEIERLRIALYGQKRGSERIRFKNEKTKTTNRKDENII